VLQCVAVFVVAAIVSYPQVTRIQMRHLHFNVLQCAAVCCSVLQCVAVFVAAVVVSYPRMTPNYMRPILFKQIRFRLCANLNEANLIGLDVDCRLISPNSI